MLRTVATVVVAACCLASAHAASWVVIGTDPNGEMSIDMDSIVARERFAEAVTMYSQKAASSIEGKSYLSSTTFARFDCKHRAYAPKGVMYYAEARARGAVVHSEATEESDLRFLLVGKNSHGEEVLTIACSKSSTR